MKKTFKKFFTILSCSAILLLMATTSILAAEPAKANVNVAPNFTDNDNDGVCDNRGTANCNGKAAGFTDNDNDGVCDNRGTANCNGKAAGFTDNDNDGVCDNRGTANCNGKANRFCDADNDRVCGSRNGQRHKNRS